MKRISTSISTFESIINCGYTYVDKTSLIYDLLVSNPGHYFLARPRRFGKSLLVSTLESIFAGKRHLFANLAISRANYDWKVFPIIHLELGNVTFSSREELQRVLVEKIDIEAKDLGISGLSSSMPSIRLEQLITSVSIRDSEKVILLVDEYDKPILDALNSDQLSGIVEEMRNFYSTIKTVGDKLYFSFMTGVSKFSKVSIFSGINNLCDLTMDARAADLLGYTKEELVDNFSAQIKQLGERNKWDFERTVSELAKWYDGYRFHQSSDGVYNPVSIGNCLTELEFKNYWFETGTPNFLFPILRNNAINFEDIDAAGESFGNFDPESPDPVSILFQTGYLSIKEVDKHTDGFVTYKFKFPNLEVKKSLSQAIVWNFSGVTMGENRSRIQQGISRALKECNISALVDALKVLFATVPNNIAIQKERYYQTIVFLSMIMLDFDVVTEDCTNVGRIDMVVKTCRYIYIIEFKLDGGAQAAMDQIKRKKYAQKYAFEGKAIKLIGISFSSKSRNIDDYLEEDYAKGLIDIEEELGASSPPPSTETQKSTVGIIPHFASQNEEPVISGEGQPVKE